MNAIMASLGGRAPPGQNTLTPCVESHWPGATRGSRVPGTSASRPSRSERQPSCRYRPPLSSPIPEASAPCSRSWPTRKQSSPIATDPHVRDPAPAVQRGNGSQAKTCCLSDCSWLHPLKSWSLRQTRGGSEGNLLKSCFGILSVRIMTVPHVTNKQTVTDDQHLQPSRRECLGTRPSCQGRSGGGHPL